jgi:hypothetical protein
MPAPIFISYARRTSQTAARALKAQLGDLAFLDESGIETREQFTKVIANSLMEASLAVVFADDAYFDRPYCRWEWSLILIARGTEHVYITVPAGGAYALDALPPDLRTRNWSARDLPALLQAHLKKDPPPIGSLITSMGNLATTLCYQGDLPGARKIQEQVLEVIRRVLGEEHPDTLTSMRNLAATLWSQRDLSGARNIEEQVVDVSRRVLGEEHPATLLSAWNLYLTLSDLKDEEAAKQVFTAYLAPLLQKDPAALPANLRKIQSMLRDQSEPRP